MAGQYRCEAEVTSDHISVKKQTVMTYNLTVSKGIHLFELCLQKCNYSEMIVE